MRFKKTKKDNNPDTVKYHLHKKLSGNEKARGTKMVHASEMIHQDREFCPREYALLDILKQSRIDEFTGTCQRSTWNLGNMIAVWASHQLADIGKIIGDWECEYCGRHYSFQERPEQCSNCDHHKFLYHECRFVSKESGQSCGVDILFKLKTGKLRVYEFKTMKDDAFKKLEGPLAEHKWRTNNYMRIIDTSIGDRNQIIDTDTAVVIYYSKNGWGPKDTEIPKYNFYDKEFSPFKEYIIKRDDSATQNKWNHATRLKEFRTGKKGVPLGLCVTQFCKRAQVCSVVENCFSGDYPGSA